MSSSVKPDGWEMPRILIIEDDPDMALGLAIPLEAQGYVLAFAATGEEGLQKALEFAPDLIILDVMMETGAAGFQVSLALRSPQPQSPYAALRDTPILMLTAAHTATTLRFGPDEVYLPVDDFVEKPVDPDLLLAKVGALLAAR